MNRGLLLKSFRELWPVMLLFGVALFVVQAVLAFVLPTFQEQFQGQLLQLDFLRRIFSAMLGTDLAENIGPELFQSVCWVHPVVLALVWACAIVCCTRIPAGEVDRGTIDVLLSLPVSRRQVFLAESFAWLAGLGAVLTLGCLGNIAGSIGVKPDLRPDRVRMLMAAAHLFVLAMSVGAFAWLISSLSDRRGKAITGAFIAVLASFLLNYIAQFWEPAKRANWLSILSYYRPLFIIRDGVWRWGDLAVLAGLAAVLWAAAGAVFSRRDLATL
jgi:ABC-2 type transport system permease protein